MERDCCAFVPSLKNIYAIIRMMCVCSREIIHITNIHSHLSANQCHRFEIRLILRAPQIVESFVSPFHEPFTISCNQKVTASEVIDERSLVVL